MDEEEAVLIFRIGSEPFLITTKEDYCFW